MNTPEQSRALAPTSSPPGEDRAPEGSDTDTDEHLKMELALLGRQHAEIQRQADRRFIGRKILLTGFVRTIVAVGLHADGKVHLVYDLHGNDIQLHAFKGVRFLP